MSPIFTERGPFVPVNMPSSSLEADSVNYSSAKTHVCPHRGLGSGSSKLRAAVSMVALHLSLSSFSLCRSLSKLMLQFVRVVVAVIK